MRPTQHHTNNAILRPPKGVSSEDCTPLAITRVQYDAPDRPSRDAVWSFWQPSPEEREAIASGALVGLECWGDAHPPIYIGADGLGPFSRHLIQAGRDAQEIEALTEAAPISRDVWAGLGTFKPRAAQQPEQPAKQAQSQDALDAARYRWLRDRSNPLSSGFYLSVISAYKDVRFTRQSVDAAIDAAIAADRPEREVTFAAKQPAEQRPPYDVKTDGIKAVWPFPPTTRQLDEQLRDDTTQLTPPGEARFLGVFLSEMAARFIGGKAGDYYQDAASSFFYELVDDYGQRLMQRNTSQTEAGPAATTPNEQQASSKCAQCRLLSPGSDCSCGPDRDNCAC